MVETETIKGTSIDTSGQLKLSIMRMISFCSKLLT